MTKLVSSLSEANLVSDNESYPFLLVPDGLGDGTDELWVVTNKDELQTVFQNAIEASYTGSIVMISKAGMGDFWNEFRDPRKKL